MTIFLNIKTVLNEPHLLELSNALFTATCSWLVHIAATAHPESADQIQQIRHLPLVDPPSRQLSFVPEFIVENITDYLTFLSRFNVQLFEVGGHPLCGATSFESAVLFSPFPMSMNTSLWC